jgi:hypothetical protein
MGGPGSGRKKGSGKGKVGDPMTARKIARNKAQDKTYKAMKSGKVPSAYSRGSLKKAAKKQKTFIGKDGVRYMA